jgi:TDG/mug DNA glycosylase family protein
VCALPDKRFAVTDPQGLGAVSRIHSFPPIGDAHAEVLVLGSMPGRASLLAQQYYAHPRNAFWAIIEALFEVDATWPYEKRCAQLVRHHVAVWDVLKTCTRTGSLDSDIDPRTTVANDFQRFFAGHAGIRAVFFNGAMAEKTFTRQVLPTLAGAVAALPMTRLPSTSPANASYTFERKLEQWRVITSAG